MMPENQAIYLIYSKVDGQHIMGQVGPVDIKLEPVFKVMDLMGVRQEDQMFCIEMIQKAYHRIIKLQMDKKKK